MALCAFLRDTTSSRYSFSSSSSRLPWVGLGWFGVGWGGGVVQYQAEHAMLKPRVVLHQHCWSTAAAAAMMPEKTSCLD